jgi:hypothetical protein
MAVVAGHGALLQGNGVTSLDAIYCRFNDAEYGSNHAPMPQRIAPRITALFECDYPVVYEAVPHRVREKCRKPDLDHRPRFCAIFLPEQSARDRMLNDRLGNFDGK